MFDRNNRRVLLGEDELEPAVAACPVCGSCEVSAVGVLQSSPAVRLRECMHCRAFSTDRFPLPAVLSDYYAAYYGDAQERTTSDAKRIARHAFRKLRAHLHAGDEPLRMLDFGGGDGSIAVRLAERLLADSHVRTVDVTLVDLNAASRPTPPGMHFHWHRELDDLPSAASYDVILASGILEHLREPNRALATLLRRLDIGGLLYARTPFMIAFHRLFSRLGLGPAIPYPGHLHDLGRDYWDRVLGVLDLTQDYDLLTSDTACVEASLLSRHWLPAVLAHLLKAPSRVALLRDRYDWVGGWEAVIRREGQSTPV